MSTQSTIRVNFNMISQDLLNALVDSMEQISKIEKEKSQIQDRVVRRKGCIVEDALSSDDEIVSKTISRATAEIEDRYFNSTRNSNIEDIKPKPTFGSISTIGASYSDEDYFSAESTSDAEDLGKLYNETYLFQQPIPRPRSNNIFEHKTRKFTVPTVTIDSLDSILEEQIIEKLHEKSILKKTRKFLKRSFSKSLRYLTL